MRELFYEAVRSAANVAWNAFQAVNRRIPARAFHPAWSPEPLPKSHERTKPPLGYPRRTDSLCPTCTREVRDAIVGGTRELRELVDGRPGEIPADIVLRGNEIWMVKTCPKHGTFEDLMASDARFFGRLEENFFGRDVKIAKDALHDHGSASIKYGRGAVLTVDLTNRCNMMCNPCFMDANQVGYVHELSFADIREILDNAVSIKPRRQLSVQFSGGEPTISPFFLEATRYAKEIGYFSVQCATNGIRFAQEPQFAKAAYDAGLRLAYLQFDGVGNEHNNHRGVGNLYDVKLQALDNLHAAGVDVTLVTTLVNSVNNDQVGDILRFAIRNIDKINAVSFHPVSFTGRDEEIDDETRRKQRYTLAPLAHDVKDQAGIGEPMRDWFPLSASGPFSDLKDLLGGLEAQWGSLKCGCHPNAGVPKNLDVWETLKVMDGHTGRGMGIAKQARYPWRVLLVAGMWFQDLFNYDFRRTEMCIIPYGTQLGEISFCAYNTGAGWRKIVEEMFQSATLAEWYKDKGRPPVYAHGKRVPLPSYAPAPRPSTLPVFEPSPQPAQHPAAAPSLTRSEEHTAE